MRVRRVAGIAGATVEHNKFCVSVHFRNCEADSYGAVLGAVETTLRGHDELHATRGRKVFEIRPQARSPSRYCVPNLAITVSLPDHTLLKDLFRLMLQWPTSLK